MKLELFTSIQGIKQNILTLGRAVGEEARARTVVGEMDRRIMEIKRKVASSAIRPGVLTYGPTGSTAGRETTFDEMVTLAGGRNLAAESGIVGHVNISIERLVMINPETIILSTWNPEAPGFEQMFLNDPALKRLSALRKNQVYSIPEKYLTTVSQYIVEGAEMMARLVHPELFAPENRPSPQAGAARR
jgi:iron complex transport system substrate-binding protein